MDTHRLESLTDNVFAVAMTLLVFDLRAPTVGSHARLASFLFENWPHYIGYVISFVVITLIWLQHHWVFKQLQQLDSMMFVINVVLMLFVVFLPYAASTLAFYLSQHRYERSAATFFSLALALVTAVLGCLWWWAARHRGLLRVGTTGRTIRMLNRRLLLAPGLYCAAALLATANPVAGVIGDGATTLSVLWLLRPGLLGASE